MSKTRLCYEIYRFTSPSIDRDLTVKVNECVRRVEDWAGHMGPVRLVSVSDSGTNVRGCIVTVTIEYTAHDTSKA